VDISIKKEQLVKIIGAGVVAMVSWLFNAVTELDSHLGACDVQVIALKEVVANLNDDINMLEANYNDLVFRLSGK
jgi:pantothenate synthetase